MDMQEKKLKLIEEFLRISDEQVLDKLEAIIRTESQKRYSEDIKPMSINELHAFFSIFALSLLEEQ